MTFDLQRILDGKRAYRQRLAALPLAEKLRMLDALRERALTQRRATGRHESGPDALRQPLSALGRGIKGEV